MNPGNFLLYASLICLIISAFYMFKGKIKKGILFTRLAAAASTVSVLLLLYAFIFLDYGFFYVWQHVSNEMPVFYRIAALVVGQEGTYLIWAWFSIIAVFMFMELFFTPDMTGSLTMAYSLLGCAFLIILTIMMSPFSLISSIPGSCAPSEGNGINPAILDSLMPIHIFTVFLAYAFAVIPAGASLSYLSILKNQKFQPEMPDIKNYLRISWFFLSISMITGGIWANRLLGWTGFWQWDPIQSTIMAAWLLLTASLHAIVRSKSGEYRILLPLLCISTILCEFYTTVVARSGIFSSIHSFPSTSTLWILVVFMMIISVFSYLLIRRYEKPDINKSSIYAAFSPDNTFYLTIIILLVMAFIALWGPAIDVIVFLMGRKIIISTEFYNSLLYPLILVLSYLTGICILYGKVRDRTLAYAASGYLLISTIFFIGNISIISYLPVFFFVSVSILWKAVRDIKLKSKTAVMHLTGINLIHIGFIFVVMGAAIGSYFATTHVFKYSLEEKGVYKENSGVGIRLLDYRVEHNGNDWDQVVEIELDYGKKSNESALYKRSTKFGFISYPVVKYGLFSDITIDLQGSIPHQIHSEVIELSVKKQPLISILWGGCILLITGILFTLSSDYMRRKTRKR